MNGAGEDDQYDLSVSPEEMLCTAQEFSLMRVELGLQGGDLCPLAEHLRNGFPIPPAMATMIADAMEEKPGAMCRISASRPKAGNPHDGNGNLHTRYLEIGSAYLKAMQGAKRGEAKRTKHKIADCFKVSEFTVREAAAYTGRWLKGLTGDERS